MAQIIRFKLIEIDSNICFVGRKKKPLRYCVRSVALIPRVKGPNGSVINLPEIFWQ